MTRPHRSRRFNRIATRGSPRSLSPARHTSSPPPIRLQATSTELIKQRHVSQVKVCEICENYSHSAYDYLYYPQYENCHYFGYASPQPDFFGLMSSPQIPQHEESQQFQQSTSLEDIVKFQNMIDEEELCSTQPIFHPEEDVSVDTLKIFEVNEVTQVEDYWSETSEGREVFHIKPKIVIAPNEDEDNEIKIDVISDRPEKPQIESEEGQPLIFYTVDTFVLDDPDATDSFVLEVPNELSNLKEGVHFSLPEYVDASFVVDISKGEGIT
ncbi:hypothetical protein Scep_007057 [Stephania cephalantha]|uniref:Uncharacterized protein n=1 Tax=Stephania cephalantha TaxID=152367 RepID=A0AAP0PNH1_9MAGN